jgi:serine/threonine protein kinase
MMSAPTLAPGPAVQRRLAIPTPLKYKSHQPRTQTIHSGGELHVQDVYAHPAAVAYAQQHPRRAIPKFGPYLLLQTLGEGEFGKVKLGLHFQWGEEVAIKLIRRNNINSSQRMTKVEREIEVLRVRAPLPSRYAWSASLNAVSHT